MNPATYRRRSPGILKQNPRALSIEDQDHLPKQQAVRLPSHNVYRQKSMPSAWSSQNATNFNISNIISHETTPLFGLWQGYNSPKMSSHHSIRDFNATSNLFLSGQNGTKIVAHIGTTVVMDCKITRPDLEENAPVRIY